MHIGNLRTALYCYLYARRHKGIFILRIEDTDQERFVPGATEIIYQTLQECGMTHEEGPDTGGKYGPYVQSQRKDIYLRYAKRLVQLGGAYYCFCSKERLETLAEEQSGANGEKTYKKYDKHCLHLPKEEIKRRLAAGEPYVIRQNIPLSGTSSYTDLVFGEISVDFSDIEDNILIKSDGLPTYNFANVVDDHLMKISHVFRGSEYLSSTPKYNLIYDTFKWERPQYIHLPLIMRDAQHKLSKRHGDANFDDFIKKGYLPEAIVNYIALLGWSPGDNREKLSFAELIAAFDIAGISKSGSIFDEPKLRWLNAQYLKELSPEEFNRRAIPFYEQSKVKNKYDYAKLSALLQSRAEILSDIPDAVDFLEEFGDFDNALYLNQKQKVDAAVAKAALTALIPAVEAISDWSLTTIHDSVSAFAETSGFKKGQLLWSARIAVTGRASTPGGAFEMFDLLGKPETLRRLKYSLERL
jgi:glutamyl-tRNA synthetase